MPVPIEKIAALYKERNSLAGIYRISPPNVSCWLSNYSVEVVDVDI